MHSVLIQIAKLLIFYNVPLTMILTFSCHVFITQQTLFIYCLDLSLYSITLILLVHSIALLWQLLVIFTVGRDVQHGEGSVLGQCTWPRVQCAGASERYTLSRDSQYGAAASAQRGSGATWHSGANCTHFSPPCYMITHGRSCDSTMSVVT